MTLQAVALSTLALMLCIGLLYIAYQKVGPGGECALRGAHGWGKWLWACFNHPTLAGRTTAAGLRPSAVASALHWLDIVHVWHRVQCRPAGRGEGRGRQLARRPTNQPQRVSPTLVYGTARIHAGPSLAPRQSQASLLVFYCNGVNTCLLSWKAGHLSFPSPRNSWRLHPCRRRTHTLPALPDRTRARVQGLASSLLYICFARGESRGRHRTRAEPT
jgi:hypothetical protein